MERHDYERIAADWASHGFTCDLWVDPPGQEWEDFVHEADEVVMVVEGRMEFEFEGNVYRPEIGDELIIPANVVHSSRNVGDCTALWLYGYRIVH